MVILHETGVFEDGMIGDRHIWPAAAPPIPDVDEHRFAPDGDTKREAFPPSTSYDMTSRVFDVRVCAEANTAAKRARASSSYPLPGRERVLHQFHPSNMANEIAGVRHVFLHSKSVRSSHRAAATRVQTLGGSAQR